MRNRIGGFTLLELMVVITIVAILVAIAYSNYSMFSFRSRRADGQQWAYQLAAAEERYFTTYNRYTINITGAAPAGLAFNAPAPNSEHGYYTATVALTATGYTVSVAPQGAQATDKCGTLTLNDQQVKTPVKGTMPANSNGDCWGR